MALSGNILHLDPTFYDPYPVVLLCGPPASGKTTLSANFVGRVHVDKDIDGDRFSEAIMAHLTGNPQDRDSEDYRTFAYPLAMQLLGRRIRREVEQGNRVVVDCPCLSELRLAREVDLHLSDQLRLHYDWPPVQALWVTADSGTRRERMVRRGLDRDRPKLEGWIGYLAQLPDTPSTDLVHRVIDTGKGSGWNHP